MKALILVGGYGTRLRPLTLTKPKPLVEFCNLPILLHQIEALIKVGVKVIILALSYQPDVMIESLKLYEEQYGVKFICSQETEPLGTAGPIALAAHIIRDDNEPFFVFNSDVISDYPLDSLLKFHQSHGREGSIMVTEVEEPSKYGVIVSDKSGKITKFVEKPQEYVGNHINAGLYLFNQGILNRISIKPTSIEKEIFPMMVADGELFSMKLEGFWMDIGQPKDYLKGVGLYLKFCEGNISKQLSIGPNIIGNNIIHPSVTISPNCLIGPDVVIGPNCVISEGVRLSYTTVMSNSTIGAHTWISKSIIGWNNKVGKWVRIEGVSVLGDDVIVADEVYLNGVIILPHKNLRESCSQPGQILM